MHGDPRSGSIPAMIRSVAARHGAAIALEDGDTTIRFADLPAWMDRAATGLQRLGLRPGDRLAIWAPNRWEWVVAALGAHRLGVAIVPLNTRYKGDEARYIIDRAGCRALVTVDRFLGVDYPAMLDRPDLPTVRLGTPDWDALVAPGGDPLPEDPLPDAVSDVLFTSGTTGKPKGVVTTHDQSLRVFATWSDVVGLRAGDRYLVVAPFFHCFGYKAGWLAALMTGATVLPEPVFDVDRILARIARDRPTVLPGPPALYQSLLFKDRSAADLSSLRLAVTGAATVPERLVREMREVLGFETVLTAYGLTESTGVVTMCRRDDDNHTVATTSGRAIPGVEVKVVDADGAPVPTGEPGEVLVRGYNVMVGYLDDPVATAETVVDGWLRTGDIGVLDAAGNLRVTDRLKDMFICGGFNAYPAEIEHVLLDHPAVAEAAVVGTHDERLGEVGLAYVVARRPVTEAELIEFAKARLANFKVPRRVVFLDALPRNASNKVVKGSLPKA